jgi:hypothetical protein
LLAHDAAARLVAVDEQDVARQERLAAARLALQARQLTLADVLAECGWTAAVERLIAFSHWVTPSVMAARFDTWFFVAEMPARQAALHCTIETSEGIWIRPTDLLAGQYATVYATQQHLRRIAPFAHVAELVEFARSKPIRCVQPRVIEQAGGLHVELPPGLDTTW